MNIDTAKHFILPNWPAPSNVHALSTTRHMQSESIGCSQSPYDRFNLASHVGDQEQHVAQNRQQLLDLAQLPGEPTWLNQVHGCQVVRLDQRVDSFDADASCSYGANQVCVVMTADCLPLLFCTRQGDKVAAAHAGWRGLAEGVIETTVEALNAPADDILVWLGPAIGADVFEVGAEVFQAFVKPMPQAESAFKVSKPGHYFADLYQLARLRLKRLGISAVYGGEHCTFVDINQFYSYRRDGKTGRQASLIWFD